MTLDQTELLTHVRQCFGATCAIENFVQVKGGARKQVFFLQLRNPNRTCVLYLWHNAENYFAERVAGGFEETQTDDKAPALFVTNTRYLLAHGVNVPQVLYTGTIGSGHHFAFVERIDGSEFNTFAATASARERHDVLTQMGAQLTKMHSLQRVHPGTLEDVAGDQHKLPQDIMLDRALLEVDATAEAQPDVTAQWARIKDKLQALHAPIVLRLTYHLLHGELPGNHVLVRVSDQAVYFVDIEGIHFADLEFEHTFLQWVYAAADYRYLARTDLDPARLAFYKLAMHVSLVYAGSCFMLRGFYDQAWAERLFARNLTQVLNMV